MIMLGGLLLQTGFASALDFKDLILGGVTSATEQIGDVKDASETVKDLLNDGTFLKKLDTALGTLGSAALNSAYWACSSVPAGLINAAHFTQEYPRITVVLGTAAFFVGYKALNKVRRWLS